MLSEIRTPDGRFTQQAVQNLASWGYTKLQEDEKPRPDYVKLRNEEQIRIEQAGLSLLRQQEQQAALRKWSTEIVESYLSRWKG